MGEAHEPRSGCPINAAIEVFGDRWSLLVVRDIVSPARSPSVRERLNAAYLAVANSS
jgi:DNA-binding HxlR family transcriptional regulator